MTESLLPTETAQDETSRTELAGAVEGLREVPGFPQATDEAVLRMSLPPAYTACPNPFLSRFIVETESARQGDSRYTDPGPFAADVSVGKSHPIYKAHSYPTKVPHQAIMRFILHYTRPGDVVLDGFCGTGMTGVAAQACGNPEPELKLTLEKELGQVRWGARRAVLQDLSPSATFIAAGLNLPVDAAAFDERSKKILERFEADWGWMYETSHPTGGTGKIDYTVWSEVFTCPHCGGEVVFYEAAFEPKTGRVRDSFRCPNCGAGATKDSLGRRLAGLRTLAGDTIQRVEFRPVRIHYRIGKARHDKTPDESDINVLRRIPGARLAWFPTDPIPLPWMYHGSRLGPKGFTHAHHMSSDRALASLSVLWNWCTEESDQLERLALMFWVEQAIWGMSWLNRFVPTHFSQVNRQMTGVYYVASLSSECTPAYNLEGKRQHLVKMWAKTPARHGGVAISTASSTRIDIPDDSIDYVFVDPPFGANIPYADLGFLIESWHGVAENPGEEAIVDTMKPRPKQLPEYQNLMERCFTEFNRVLKPGRWMTVEFNNSSNQVWLAIQAALAAAGFVVADTRVFDKEHLSYRQVTATNAVKRDLIISAYKPDREQEEHFKIIAGTEDGAWQFVHEHLTHLPVADGRRGQAQLVRERMADRLYDRMVAYHVSRGHQPPLSAGEFYVGLEKRLPVRDDMYFLTEQVETYERHRMTFKELEQTPLFITTEASAVTWLRQRLKARPRTYDQIMPDFFREAQAGLADWEKLPDLKALLDENFLQDEAGRWYVPDPKKTADLEKVRTRALLREFSAYAESRGKIARFRSEAVRAGFKDAWGRRDFASIVNVGDRLPPDAFAGDEQLLYYYDNARKLKD